MARGRMISAAVSTNHRLAGVSDTAFRAYVYALANADRDGRIPADPAIMLHELYPALAISCGWTEDTVNKLASELVSAGLWNVGGEFYEVERFHDHQRGMRYEREKPSRWVTPEASGPNPESSGPTPEASGGVRSLKPELSPQVEVERKQEVEAEVEAPAEAASENENHSHLEDSTGRDGPAEIRRVLASWATLYEQVNSRRAERGEPPRIPPPATIYEAESVVSLGNTRYFKTDELLVAEMSRVSACFEEKGWTITFRGVVKQLGQRFEGCARPDPVTWEKIGRKVG